jgi:protein O-GlcNAc transferase
VTKASGQKSAAEVEQLFAKGLAFHSAGQFPEAVRSYTRILEIDDSNARALALLGSLHVQRGELKSAVGALTRSLKIDSRQALALTALGDALSAAKRYDHAVEVYDKALDVQPDHGLAYIKRGDALRALKRYESAVASYDRAIALRPELPEIRFFRALALQGMGRDEDALAGYAAAIRLKPDFAEAYHNRANVLLGMKRHEAALADYDRAVTLNPVYAQAYSNRSHALKELGRYEDALTSCDKAITVQPDYAGAHLNRGNVLRAMGRFEEAVASYDRAIAIKPIFPEAYNNRALALRALKRHMEALGSYDTAITLSPENVDAYQNRAALLKELRRFEEAIVSCDAAIARTSASPAAYFVRADALFHLGRFDEALEASENVLELDPEFPYARGNDLWFKMHLCDWRDIDQARSEVLAAIERGGPACPPFANLAMECPLEMRRRCAEVYAKDRYPLRPLAPRAVAACSGRIRIAYLSADYRMHPMPYLMAGVFELHDREQFEVYAISFGRDDKSDIRARLESAFEHFVDVSGWDDRAIARFLMERNIDIAVDLMGFTDQSRPGILAFRPAPVQVNYLGFPGTLGADWIDYMIADPVLVPPEERQHYSEQVVYLPDTYLSSDPKRRAADHVPTRAELGLPAAGFVFCAFHNSCKITPEMFDVWMRILRQTDGSVLWLLDCHSSSSRNLMLEAQARGVEPERLVFAKRIPFAEHLARHRRADLFLDTLPYGGHTSASDSLFAGVPVLTCRGDSFAGRVAMSVLRALGLPELVTQSPAQFEALAVELARDPAALGAIKQKLSLNRHTQPAFDAVRFTRHLESAYSTMVQRSKAGDPPASFAVEPITPGGTKLPR